MEGELSEPTRGLLKAVYACTLCGACYENCKQIKEVVDVKELKREREQAWCCGSGGGVNSAFDEFAL